MPREDFHDLYCGPELRAHKAGYHGHEFGPYVRLRVTDYGDPDPSKSSWHALLDVLPASKLREVSVGGVVDRVKWWKDSTLAKLVTEILVANGIDLGERMTYRIEENGKAIAIPP